MNYIEIIGPQAAGKSLLLKNLNNLRTEKNEWNTFKTAVKEIANGLQWNQLTGFKNKVLHVLNKLNRTNYKKFGTSNLLLKNIMGDLPISVLEKYEFLIDAQFASLHHTNIHISSINKSALINWHIQSLQKLFMLEFFDYDKTVLFTEGPLKTHYGIHHINLDDINREALPKAVISCTLSIEDNISRIRKRDKKTGRTSKIHNRLNNESLKDLVAYTHEVGKQNLEFIERLGIPIKKINLSDEIDEIELHRLNLFLENPELFKSDSILKQPVMTAAPFPS